MIHFPDIFSRRQLNIICDNYGHDVPVTVTGNDDNNFSNTLSTDQLHLYLPIIVNTNFMYISKYKYYI